MAWSVVDQDQATIHYWSAAGGEQLQPNVSGMARYSAWIDEATGEVYFVRSRSSVCGRSVTIRRSMLGSSESTVLAPLPPRIDTGWSMSVAANVATSDRDLYFERWSCGPETGDVYALASVDSI